MQCNVWMWMNNSSYCTQIQIVLQQLPVVVERDWAVNAGVSWSKVGWSSVPTTTWSHIPEDCNINIHCHEITRYSVILLFWLYDVNLGCILMFRWINVWAELMFFMFFWFSRICWALGIYFVLVCFSTLAGLQTTRKCTIQHPSFLKCKIGKRQLSSS